MATTNPNNQLALDLGDTIAKLSVRDLIVRGEIDVHQPPFTSIMFLQTEVV